MISISLRLYTLPHKGMAGRMQSWVWSGFKFTEGSTVVVTVYQGRLASRTSPFDYGSSYPCATDTPVTPRICIPRLGEGQGEKP